MPDRIVLIQYVTNQRDRRPHGLRIWSDGLMQRCAEDNPLPGPMERLDVDRELRWEDVRRLGPEQLDAIRAAMDEVGFFNLPPRFLINYCKEDPGTMIWTATMDGRTARIVIFDPRPNRSAELDDLAGRLDQILAQPS